MVSCPICGRSVKESTINAHIDSGCEDAVEAAPAQVPPTQNGTKVASLFRTPAKKPVLEQLEGNGTFQNSMQETEAASKDRRSFGRATGHEALQPPTPAGSKRPALELESDAKDPSDEAAISSTQASEYNPSKRPKTSSSAALHRAQPLAERMRPRTLDDVLGQELLGEHGTLRGLIENDRVPSMVLWGGPGTGKTTIARIMAHKTGARFIELNSTSTGVNELKKIFAESRNDLSLTGRKTILFCDEIHRFSKSQQDVFLGPVEAGICTLVGATTENPSFKVQAALLSRCRVFTLQKLGKADVVRILERALETEGETYSVNRMIVDTEMIAYLAAFADGDARTGLNLLELAMDLSSRAGADKGSVKRSLTKTLVYDRAGDQHYDTISAFHKSVRGSNADATLYYLARMLQSGEDPLFIARRMVVIASEDIGIADNSMLSLATAAYSAAEKIGMPEARINLAHCAVALALSKKSTRAYRGLGNAMAALNEPGVAGLPIPVHLRNAPTRLMKELGYGKEYKYNPRYVNGKVKQDYLPAEIREKTLLEDQDFGSEVDDELGDRVQCSVAET